MSGRRRFLAGAAAVWAAGAGLAPAALAQAVWRCGPDGRRYSDSPCAGGRPVDTGTPRSAADAAAARADTQRLQAWVAREQRQREREEARLRAASAHAANLGPRREDDRAGAVSARAGAAAAKRPRRPRPAQARTRPRPPAAAG